MLADFSPRPTLHAPAAEQVFPTPPPPIRPGAPALRAPLGGDRKRGAPLGNTNALKHGFYSRAFFEAEQSELTAIDPASLESEIQLLRVFILRTAIQAEKVTDLTQSLILLNVMSRASISLAALMRTQRAALAAHAHDEFQLLIAQSQAEFKRANALTARLETQLTTLETAALRATQPPLDPANPIYRYPTVELPPGFPPAAPAPTQPEPEPAKPQPLPQETAQKQLDQPEPKVVPLETPPPSFPRPELRTPVGESAPPLGGLKDGEAGEGVALSESATDSAEVAPAPDSAEVAPATDSAGVAPAPDSAGVAIPDIEPEPTTTDSAEGNLDNPPSDIDLDPPELDPDREGHPPLDCFDCHERPGCVYCPPNLLPTLAPRSYTPYP